MRTLFTLATMLLAVGPLVAQAPFGTSVVAAPGAQIAAGTAGAWAIDESTTGGDVHWTSPTSVDPNSFAYDSIIDVTLVEVTALALGIFPITVDVTGDLPPEFLHTEANFAGPAPIELLGFAIDFPGAPEPTVLAGDLSFGLDAAGFAFFDFTNVVFGTAIVDNPFGGGTISAPITELRIVATLSIDPVSWLDLGNGLAPVGGVAPVLAAGGTLAPLTPVSLELSGAALSAPTFIVLGFTAVNAPAKGGVLVPAPDWIKGGPPVGGSGGYLLPATWPAGIPAGFELYAQIWVVDPAGPVGFSATNGLVGQAK